MASRFLYSSSYLAQNIQIIFLVKEISIKILYLNDYFKNLEDMFWYKHQNFSTVHCGEAARNLWWYGHVEVIEIGSGWSKNRKRIIAKLEFQKCHKHALSLIPSTQFAAMKIISKSQVRPILPTRYYLRKLSWSDRSYILRRSKYLQKIEKGRHNSTNGFTN